MVWKTANYVPRKSRPKAPKRASAWTVPALIASVMLVLTIVILSAPGLYRTRMADCGQGNPIPHSSSAREPAELVQVGKTLT
jgi:hypothetical protein